MTRRAALLGALVAAGCARRKGAGFPGYAFVANGGARSVAAVDLTRFAVVRQIGLDAAPADILAHPSRPAVFVLMPEIASVWEIDAAKLAPAVKTRLPGTALSMQLSADGKSLWVLQPRALVRLDCERLRPVQSIRLPGIAGSFDVSRDGRAAIGFPALSQVALARTDNGTIEHTVADGPEPSLVRFQSDGKQVLVASRAYRSLTILESVTGRTVVRLPLPVAPENFCFTPDGGQLFVTGAGMDAVAIVFPYRTEVGETILAGRAPDGMAVSTVPSFLFVANPSSGSITVLDIDTRKLVAVVSVGQEPRHILITPDNQYALVLNRRSGDMGVVHIPAFRARRHRTDPPPLFTMVPVGQQPIGSAVVRVIT
jgi:YVTN family beta-propeller protein